MEKIVLTEEHMDTLKKLDDYAANNKKPSPVMNILRAALCTLYQFNDYIDDDINSVRSKKWGLDIAGAAAAYAIVAYNKEHPVKENTFACGYVGEEDNKRSTPNLDDLMGH